MRKASKVTPPHLDTLLLNLLNMKEELKKYIWKVIDDMEIMWDVRWDKNDILRLITHLKHLYITTHESPQHEPFGQWLSELLESVKK